MPLDDFGPSKIDLPKVKISFGFGHEYVVSLSCDPCLGVSGDFFHDRW